MRSRPGRFSHHLKKRKVLLHFDALYLPKGSAIAIDMPMNVNAVGIPQLLRTFLRIHAVLIAELPTSSVTGCNRSGN